MTEQDKDSVFLAFVSIESDRKLSEIRKPREATLIEKMFVLLPRDHETLMIKLQLNSFCCDDGLIVSLSQDSNDWLPTITEFSVVITLTHF